MEKKDSIFARLNPPPPPQAQPRPAEPRPDAAELEAAALKRKMDSMEKNLAAQLEKKITDLLTAAPAAKRPDADSAALAARIAELDKRLEEFARTAVTSAVQLKNIEESKISARREIEDLLKVVREQQKYTEMDREMHDQLAKSWVRAEELEKKLMDFCGTVLIQKNQGAVVQGALPPAPAPAPAPAPVPAPAENAALAELKKEFMAELARTREETLALNREQAAFFKTMFEEQVKNRLDVSQAATAAELERVRKETAAEIEANRRKTAEELDVLKKDLSAQLRATQALVEGLGRAAQENFSAAEGAAAAGARNAADSADLLGQKLDRVSETLRQEGEKMLAGLEERNKRCFEALNQKYAEALSSASSMNYIGASAEAVAQKMAVLEKTLAVLLEETDRERLGAALGVSAIVVRRNFEAMESLLTELRDGAAFMGRVKKDVDNRLGDIFGSGK